MSAPAPGLLPATPRRDLYPRLVMVLAAALVAGFIVGMLVLLFLQDTLIRRAGETLSLAAANTANRLDRVLLERAGDSQMMSRAFSGRTAQREFVSAYLAWMGQAYPVYQWIGVLDPKGTVIATNASEWGGQNRSQMDWFRRAHEHRALLVLDAKPYAETNGQVAVGFVSPIRAAGTLEGLVVSFVTLRLLEESYLNLKQGTQGLGTLETGVEYIVLDQDGIALIDSLLYQEGHINLSHLSSIQRLRETGRPGYVEERAPRRGMTVITGYARTGELGLHGPRWDVLVRASRDEIVQPIRRITGMVALGGLVVMVPLLVLVGWMLQRLRQETRRVQASEEALRHAHVVLEQRIAERTHEVMQKQQQLVQTAKLASLGQLSAGIAHELNNPLNNISLFVGNALDEINEGLKGRQLQDPLRQKLLAAQHQIRRAADIIQQLRTFARSAGTRMGPVHLKDVVQAALALLGEQLRLKSIAVDVKLQADPAVVTGNTLQLEQVLVNLLSNAADALTNAPVKRISVSVRPDGEYHVLRIADTGHGIPPEQLSHIFDPFYTTKEVGEGTGLGLSIVYGIIKDHSGHITVDSTVGAGTTFEIKLPSAGSNS